MSIKLAFLMLLCGFFVAGCDGYSTTTTTYISSKTTTNLDFININHGNVIVHAPDRTDADITATGDLSIAGNNVAVNDTQRDLLKHYYTTALAIRDHGIATGEAGAALAGNALSSVASGLASGDTSKIDSEVNASADKVEAKAALICTDLADLRSTQETLASQLPAFQPYAQIKANEADDCRRGLHTVKYR